MIVPSIDLMDGNAVQLVGGKAFELDAGDPMPIARRFGRVGEIAVVDLDAALGKGENASVIEQLVRAAPCRVGGGIRSVEAAIRWLDAGATKVVLGTAATPEVLGELPRARVVAALDAGDGEVVVEGWQTKTGVGIVARIRELRDYVGGFLVTFVEKEGRLGGTAMERVAEIVEAAGDARVTIAGGVSTAAEVGELDGLGADAQVGIALYKGLMPLADAFAAPLRSDRADGLWPTVVCDERGVTLGLAYSNAESLGVAIEEGIGAYWSRTRGLWRKGASSGDVQELIDVAVDCDRDALRFRVRQSGGGFCHTGTRTCFGADGGLGALERTIAARLADAPAGSYTKRLATEPGLLGAKLKEEAGELADAVGVGDVAWEAADVIYFALVKAIGAGATLADVERVLDGRALKVTRRPGNRKDV